jgi:DNA-binding Lrp family transcriptional regulator
VSVALAADVAQHSSGLLVNEIGISRKAALATLHRLADLGILTEYGIVKNNTPGQPASLYVV